MILGVLRPFLLDVHGWTNESIYREKVIEEIFLKIYAAVRRVRNVILHYFFKKYTTIKCYISNNNAVNLGYVLPRGDN